MNTELFWHKTLHRPYRLAASVHGDRTKPAIVLLHGIAASSEDWQKLIALLMTDYCCITIDLLGFARSPKPQWSSYSVEEHLRSLDHTIAQLGIRKPYVLAGHSLGGLLATAYARQHPKDISRLLLLSPPVYPPLESITKRSALRRTGLLMRVYKFMRTHPDLTPQDLRRLGLVTPLPRSLVKQPDTWLPFCLSLERCIEQQTIIQDIEMIKVPVDVFYGSLDTVVIGYNVRQLAKIKNARIHPFRGNHGIGRTYAKTVATVLLNDDV